MKKVPLACLGVAETESRPFAEVPSVTFTFLDENAPSLNDNAPCMPNTVARFSDVAAESIATSLTSTSNENPPFAATLNDLLNKDYSLVQYVPTAPTRMVWRDDPVIESENELLMQLNKVPVQTGVVRYMPKGVSMSRTENAFYAYFTTDGARVEPLHLRVQYYADDPLQFNDIVFTIDGFDYRFRALSPQRGKGTGRMIWELCDQEASSADKDLVYALAHAHWVRMSLVGSDGTKHVKMLTETQIRDFYLVLQLFRMLGGRIG